HAGHLENLGRERESKNEAGPTHEGQEQGEGDAAALAAVHPDGPPELGDGGPDLRNAAEPGSEALCPPFGQEAQQRPQRHGCPDRSEAAGEYRLEAALPVQPRVVGGPKKGAAQGQQPDQAPQTDGAVDQHRGYGNGAATLLAGEERRLDDVTAD